MLIWPNTISGMRYFLINQLGFTTTNIGMIFTISSLFYIVYMFFLNTFYSNYSLKGFYVSICFMMFINVLVRVLQIVPQLYSLAFFFAVIDQSINNLFYDLPNIPLLTFVVRKVPKQKEAIFYGFFVSLSNFCCSFSNFSGFVFLGLMDVTATDFTNLQWVNMLSLLWALCMWNFVPLVQFPEYNKISVKKVRSFVKPENVSEQF